MREQRFIIDGDKVSFFAIDTIGQAQAENWYRMYRQGGNCPFEVLVDSEIPEPPYIEHLEASEKEATENYIEYCQYAQKLQTELNEGSLFIRDTFNNLSLELAGIEEERMSLDARESEIKRQISYLTTVNNVLTKRKKELDIEYERTAKETNTSNRGDAIRTQVEEELF